MPHAPCPTAARWAVLLFLPALPSCLPQEGQINSLKDSIAAVRESNQAATTELGQLNQKISTLNQQARAQQSQRNEFEGKSKQSSETERIVVKYREDLEREVAKYTEDVASYRKKHLTP